MMDAAVAPFEALVREVALVGAARSRSLDPDRPPADGAARPPTRATGRATCARPVRFSAAVAATRSAARTRAFARGRPARRRSPRWCASTPAPAGADAAVAMLADAARRRMRAHARWPSAACGRWASSSTCAGSTRAAAEQRACACRPTRSSASATGSTSPRAPAPPPPLPPRPLRRLPSPPPLDPPPPRADMQRRQPPRRTAARRRRARRCACATCSRTSPASRWREADGAAPFVELGLDSLTLTQAALQVKKHFKVNADLPPADGELPQLRRAGRATSMRRCRPKRRAHGGRAGAAATRRRGRVAAQPARGRCRACRGRRSADGQLPDAAGDRAADAADAAAARAARRRAVGRRLAARRLRPQPRPHRRAAARRRPPSRGRRSAHAPITLRRQEGVRRDRAHPHAEQGAEPSASSARLDAFMRRYIERTRQEQGLHRSAPRRTWPTRAWSTASGR